MKYLENISLPIKEYESPWDMYPDMHKQDIVVANYREVLGVRNNPDMCALTPPLTGTALLKANIRVPLMYPRGASTKKSERLMSLRMLKNDMKVYLPFHAAVERGLRECLMSAYSARKYGYTSHEDNDQKEILSVSENISTSVQDMLIVGTTGTGKSSAIDMALSRIPKGLWHGFSNGYSYTQIPCLKIVAHDGKDVKGIFYDFARQIDRIVDTNGLYGDKMQKLNLGRMESLFVELVELFHIGAIIIDELQLSKNPKMLDTILHVTASAGVSVVLVGTEETFNVLMPEKSNNKGWFTRRFMHLGRVVADIKENDTKAMKAIIGQLFRCQLTKKEYSLTEGIQKALEEESLRNIDFLTTLHITCQRLIIEEDDGSDTLVYDEQLVKRAARLYPMTREYLQSGSDAVLAGYEAEKHNFMRSLEDKAQRERQREEAENMAISEKLFVSRMELLSDVISRVQNVIDASPETIEAVCDKMEKKKKGFLTMDPRQRAKLVTTELLNMEQSGEYKKIKAETQKTTEEKERQISAFEETLKASGEDDDVAGLLSHSV